MEFNELFNLLQNSDETDRIEAKSASHGIGKSFLETVSAYSNEPGLGGGYILLGITKNGEAQDFKYAITINGVDTLMASAHLRRLRDLELLEQKGRGNATYYVPTIKLLAPGISAQTPGISTQTPGVIGLPDRFPPLSSELIDSLKKIGKRAAIKEVQSVILQLCSLAPLRLPELVDILRRDADHIRKRYLVKMLEQGELEYTFPDAPNHPQQAYRTKKS
jgi:ATP-dependent DNA helicase RecG